VSNETREYYLYGDKRGSVKIPVLFQPQPDGGLLILSVRLSDKKVVPDTSFYGLIHFDRNSMARKVNRETFLAELDRLGVSEAAFEKLIQADAALVA
jgi:hypothetical protein